MMDIREQITRGVFYSGSRALCGIDVKIIE